MAIRARAAGLLSIVLAAGVLLGPAAAGAQSSPLAGVALPMARGASKQQAADEKAVREVWDGGGFAAIEGRREGLIRALDHAPAKFPMIEKIDANTIVVRAEDMDAAMFLTIQAAGVIGPGGKSAVRQEFNTYPLAALLLGAYAVEKNRPQEALGFLERGLALQPDNPLLINEKAAAHEALRQPDKALAAVEPWLAAGNIASDPTRARLLRAKGFALTELDRLPEAEAAYRESLKLEPGHPGAQRELAYIDSLRQGKARQAVGLQTSEKAAAGKALTPLPPGDAPKP
jgi:tetratricopeptide (TPR) repeat protein